MSVKSKTSTVIDDTWKAKYGRKYYDLDVVMHFSKSDGSKTEITVNLKDDLKEIAKQYCIDHKLKTSRISELADVIRVRFAEVLDAHVFPADVLSSPKTPLIEISHPKSVSSRSSQSHSSPAPSLNPFESEHLASTSRPPQTPFDHLVRSGGDTTSRSETGRGAFQGLSPVDFDPFSASLPLYPPAQQSASSSSSCNRGAIESSEPDTGTAASMDDIWSTFETTKHSTTKSEPNTTKSPKRVGGSMFVIGSSPGSTGLYRERGQNLHIDTNWAGRGRSTQEACSPLELSPTEHGKQDDEVALNRRSSAPAGLNAVKSGDHYSSFTTRTSHLDDTMATAGTSDRGDDAGNITYSHQYLIGEHLLSPTASQYMPKMGRNGRRSHSHSPHRPRQRDASSIRLYSEHERVQHRHSLLAQSVEKMRQDSIDATSFLKSSHFLASSPSAKDTRHREHGESFHASLYYSDLKWAAVRDKETSKRALALKQEIDELELSFATFAPQLHHTPLHASTRSTSSANIFDALYETRKHHDEKIARLREDKSRQQVREHSFSPKIFSPLSNGMAERWRAREDNIQRQAQSGLSEFCDGDGKRNAAGGNMRPLTPVPVVAGGIGEKQPGALTLMDLAKGGIYREAESTALAAATSAALDSTNPFDSFLQLQDQEVENEANGNTDLSRSQHLGFFDSFTAGQEGTIKWAGDGSPANPFALSDDLFLDFEDDCMTLSELQPKKAAASTSPVPCASITPKSKAALFERLHKHSVAVAIKAAEEKHKMVHPFRPNISRSADTHPAITVEEHPDKFFARMSQNIKSKSIYDHDRNRIPSKKIPLKAEKDLLNRLTVHYPRRTKQWRQEAIDVMQNSIKHVQVHTQGKSEALAKEARRSSLQSIFDLLLATVDYCFVEMDREKQKEKERQQNQAPNANAGAASQNLANASITSASSPTPEQRLPPGTLDTRYCLPHLLHPPSLVQAINTLLEKVRPAPLTLSQFTAKMEHLIFSGQCAPISAHLTAPDRLVTRQHEMKMQQNERDAHMTYRPVLKAAKKSEGMALKRKRASQVEYKEYIAQRERKLEEIRSRHQEEQDRECTFAPTLPSTETFLAAKARQRTKEKLKEMPVQELVPHFHDPPKLDDWQVHLRDDEGSSPVHHRGTVSCSSSPRSPRPTLVPASFVSGHNKAHEHEHESGFTFNEQHAEPQLTDRIPAPHLSDGRTNAAAHITAMSGHCEPLVDVASFFTELAAAPSPSPTKVALPNGNRTEVDPLGSAIDSFLVSSQVHAASEPATPMPVSAAHEQVAQIPEIIPIPHTDSSPVSASIVPHTPPEAANTYDRIATTPSSGLSSEGIAGLGPSPIRSIRGGGRKKQASTTPTSTPNE